MAMLSSIHIISDTKLAMATECLIGQGFFDIQKMTDFLDAKALFMAQGWDASFQIVRYRRRHSCRSYATKRSGSLLYTFGRTAHPKLFQMNSAGN
jgi:hypothetical protein